MCLTLIVRVPVSSREALIGAAAALPPTALAVEPPRTTGHASRWPWAQPRDTEIVVSCLCELLTDEADWNDATWAMHPGAREMLAQTLEALTHASPSAVVEVLWVGDRAVHEEKVSPAELAAITRASALGTKTRYVVSVAPAS
jgi:hypothetical protein